MSEREVIQPEDVVWDFDEGNRQDRAHEETRFDPIQRYISESEMAAEELAEAIADMKENGFSQERQMRVYQARVWAERMGVKG